MNKISHETLTEILNYDPDTGFFHWAKPRPKIRVGQRAGCLHHKGYINIEIHGKHYAAHRLAWFYMNRKWPLDQIDHINVNRSDNRICNLREATNSQNRANSRSANRTGFKGVSYKNWLKDNPYEAKITFNKKYIYLGCFATAEKAHEAYVEAAIRFQGEYHRP